MLFSMRTRVDYLADKYGFTELNESPVFADSGGMFWRRSVGRQMSGQKKSSVLLLIQFYFLMRLQQFCCAIYSDAYCCNRIAC